MNTLNVENLRHSATAVASSVLLENAGELAPAKRAEAMLHLTEVRDGVIAITKGLSASQWSYRPAPDRWSIGEVVEHLALTQNISLQSLEAELSEPPSPVRPRHEAEQMDALVSSKLLDRSIRVSAPPPLWPSGTWTREETIERYGNGCRRLRNLLVESSGLRSHFIFLPPMGQPVDGYQMILAHACHSERHIRQLLAIKASPDFPVQ